MSLTVDLFHYAGGSLMVRASEEMHGVEMNWKQTEGLTKPEHDGRIVTITEAREIAVALTHAADVAEGWLL